jgi:MFS superfamily sulfate permease-like transporter
MRTDQARPARTWPVFQALGGATPASLGRDVLAGLTLAAIAVPEQMATARLGGFPPQLGFFAFAAATVGFALFGANRQLSAGGDSTITPIFAGSLALLAVAGSAQYAALAAVLALMVGVLLVTAGLFKLGWIADLLSGPVITGFLAGIAAHIVLSQAPSVLGLPEGSGDVFHSLAAIAARAGAINLPSVAIGLGVFAVIFITEKLEPRLPGALIALVGAAAATAWLGLAHHGVAVLGAVPAELPRLAVPSLDFAALRPLAGLAFIVALVVMVQTGATTRSFSGGDGDPDVARDYIGLGAGSLLAGLFGTFPVNASPPRTAVVAASGGRSQYAGLTAAVAVLALAGFGTRLLTQVPTAALGGVLLFVAQRIFHAGVFRQLLRRTPAEFALAVLTVLLIVILPIQTGVAIAVFLSLVHGVFTITRAQPIVFERMPGATVWWPASPGHPGETVPGVLVLGFQAPLSFLNAYEFRRGLLGAAKAGQGSAHLLVLEASSLVEIDFTAAGVFRDVIAAVRAAGIDFAVARLESVRAQTAFDRFGVTDTLGHGHVFPSVQEAVTALGPKTV